MIFIFLNEFVVALSERPTKGEWPYFNFLVVKLERNSYTWLQ